MDSVDFKGMAYRVQSLGLSHSGRAINCHHFLPQVTTGTTAKSSGAKKKVLLVLGGTHGNECATVVLLERWVEHLLQTQWLHDLHLMVLPCLNPDGYAANTRTNGRGVDLNRNFPAGWSADSEEPPGPYPLSEKESVILHDLVLACEPAAIISLHWALAELDGDGEQSRGLIETMWQALPPDEKPTYRRRLSLAYHTSAHQPSANQGPPGSFGRWAGYQVLFAENRQPAMVTLELPYRPKADSRPDPLPESHWQEVVDRWKGNREAYLRDTYGGLCAMLDAAAQWVTRA
jgi:Zinc carboxypeptidase